MELAGQLRPSGACNLLEVPVLGSLDVDEDEGDFVIGIRPKSSPLPRRKSSLSDEDVELVPPLCGSRRVSFADAAGLSLVQVKEFDIWDVPKLPNYDSSEGRENDSEEYFISPSNFWLPLSAEELSAKVRDQKVELESVELLPGTTILRGVIRVLNISFDKAVYVRTSLDSWSTHFDLLAEYIPGSSEGLIDCFSFRLTLVPPFREQGAKVDFCLRYETPVGTFWANNDSRNYTLFCSQRAKEEVEGPQRENMKRKSCLKAVSQIFPSVENMSAVEAPCQEKRRTDVCRQAEEEEEEEAVKVKETFDDQSGTSEGDEQLSPTKSRRSCSRRSRRKAARMARVRDYFSQRNGADDPDGSPSEAQRELNAESKSVSDVLQETSQSPSESVDRSDSSASAGGESASDSPSESRSISRSEPGAEESTPQGGVCHESRHDSAEEPLEALVSAASAESFTFGTVVAPLYRQAFVSADGGNSALNVDGERREIRCSAPKDTEDSITDAPQSFNTESVDERSLHPAEREITRPNQRCMNSSHVPKTIPAETEERPNTAGTLRTDGSDTLILAEGSDLQREEQEKDLTPHLQRQNTAEETQESLERLKPSEFSGQIRDQTEEETSRSNETEEAETATKQRAEVPSEDVSGDSAPEETLERPACCSGGLDVSVLQGSPQTQEEMISDSLKHQDMSALFSADAAEVKNWETMVEEDEMNLLTDDEEISIQAGDIEAVEEDDSEQLEDAGRETVSEEKDATAEEEDRREDDDALQELTRSNQTEDEAVNAPEEKQVKGQDEETAGGEEGTDVRTRTDPQETERDFKETITDVKFDTALEIQEENHIEGNEDEERQGDEELDGVKTEDRENVTVCFEERSESPQNQVEHGLPASLNQVEHGLPASLNQVEHGLPASLNQVEHGLPASLNQVEHGLPASLNQVEHGLSASLNQVQERRVTTEEEEEEEFQTLQAVDTHQEGSISADRASCFSYHKLDDSETSVDGASSDSDSDDEVELYMHCLRAVHTGPQLNKDSGFSVGRRPSVNRSKLLSSPMPSISESLDEEQSLSGLQENLTEPGDYQFTAAENPEENVRPVWWRETFSCRNVGKVLLYAALFLLFLVVARQYDFLACFGLYLISLVWLWFQGERQKVNSSQPIS